MIECSKNTTTHIYLFHDKKKKKNREKFLETYLPLVGRGNPSNAHAICGVGFPAAEHFNDTAGPG